MPFKYVPTDSAKKIIANSRQEVEKKGRGV
jgi:hypothetical protein